MKTGGKFSIEPLGDAVLFVACHDAIQVARDWVRGLATLGEQDRLAGVTDIVPAFNLLGVYFDPRRVAAEHATLRPMAEVRRWLERCCADASAAQTLPPVQPVVIPVVYGGEHGPDLDAVAEMAGIRPDEVTRRHSEAEYRVEAVGFAPGFGYLEGLPTELRLPRRATPRTRVPAGSVAIGGPYTGIYPQASPGGWHVIGRTPLNLFSLDNDPPSLLAMGDRVRFRSVASAGFEDAGIPKAQAITDAARLDEPPQAFLEVVSPGVQTTLQDAGRPGWQALGVSPAGAMDRYALRLANALAGAPHEATVIETTLVGPVLRVLSDGVIGVAGSAPAEFGGARRLRVREGDLLDLRRLENGARCYLSASGGLEADQVLGSSSTDVRAGFGGHSGRALQPGDRLARAARPEPIGPAPSPTDRWFLPSPWANHAEPTRLHVMRGPAASGFDAASWRRFITQTYRVDQRSDRTGLRCSGEPLVAASSGESASHLVTHGAVQVPPDGLPVILGADRQTLGGYPVVACVVTADLPALGQLRPGDDFHFAEVSEAEAEMLRSSIEADLGRALAGVAQHLNP